MSRQRPELTKDFLEAMSPEFRAVMAERPREPRDDDEPESTDPAIRLELAAVIEGVE